jgi:hypothetical protein
MVHKECVIEAGTHHAPYWVDRISGITLCDRHKHQFDKEYPIEHYDWIPAEKVVLGSLGLRPMPRKKKKKTNPNQLTLFEEE